MKSFFDSSRWTGVSDSISSRVWKILQKAASRRWSGFTLAELIVVVTILAILAAIGFLALSGYSQDARDSAAKANVRSVLTAIRSESALTGNSPRRYVVHDSSLTGVALSSAFVEFSGKQIFLTGGAWNSPNTNYSAGNPDWAVLKLDPSKFRTSAFPFVRFDSALAAYDPKTVSIGAVDVVESSANGTARARTYLQGAAILSNGTAYVTGDAPGFSSSTGASLGLIRDLAKTSSTGALMDAVQSLVPSSSAPAGYSLANSLRLDASKGWYLSKTPPSGGNLTTWTMSFWTKRSKLGTLQDLFWALSGAGATTEFWFNASDQLFLAWNSYNTYTSSAVFRDPSAFYHIVVTWDTSNATATDRARIYVNGKRLPVVIAGSNPSPWLTSYWNSSSLSNMIGRFGSINYDGLLSSVDFVDGQALDASSFWETDPASGSWRPKQFAGTYGTWGYRLDFSSWATVASLGTDGSWRGNAFAPSAWIDLNDRLSDSPTNNFPTLNPLDWYSSAPTISSGNLKITANAATHQQTKATQAFPKTWKWYWEAVTTTTASAYSVHSLWVATTAMGTSWPVKTSTAYLNNYGQAGNQNGLIFSNGGSVNVQTINAGYAQTAGDVMRFAYDADSWKFWIGVNGNWFGSSGAFDGNPASGTNPVDTLSGAYAWAAYSNPYGAQSETYNFWQWGVSGVAYDAGSLWSFNYPAPAGFKALSTANSPTPAIANPSQYFDIVTYSGNGSTQNVGWLSFRPDMVWGKARNAVDANWLFDTTRWPNKILRTDSTLWESTASTLTSFNADGFWVDVNISQSGRNFVAWNWKEGALPGFDVVTYSGDGSNARQIPHSLGSVPAMYFTKNLDGYNNAQGFNDWSAYHKSINQSWAAGTNGPWCAWFFTTSAPASWVGGFGGIPSSSYFYPNQTAYDNVSWKNYVAYLWSEIPGFSKFGSYVGNGNADGPFVNLGFKPKFFMIKNVSRAGTRWSVFDSARNPNNVVYSALSPNFTNVEDNSTSYWLLDFVSNGVKFRDYLSWDTELNYPGDTYLYAAFAEAPFWGAGIAPATAK